MPGHFTSEKTMQEIAKLQELIQACDAVFLLTDSRESRWLPTVLGNHYKKVHMRLITDCNNFGSWIRFIFGNETWKQLRLLFLQ